MDLPSSKQLSQEFNFSGTNNSSSAFVRAKGNFLKILRIPKLNEYRHETNRINSRNDRTGQESLNTPRLML